MSNLELKPCPHCGSPGEVKKLMSSAEAYPYAAVARCSECHHGALGISQDAANKKAAESWNKRSTAQCAEVGEEMPLLLAENSRLRNEIAVMGKLAAIGAKYHRAPYDVTPCATRYDEIAGIAAAALAGRKLP